MLDCRHAILNQQAVNALIYEILQNADSFARKQTLSPNLIYYQTDYIPFSEFFGIL